MNLDILFGVEEGLLDVLKGRHSCKVGLKKVAIQSCRVHKDECRSNLRKLVKKVKWDNIEVMGSDYEETDDDTDADEFEDVESEY